MSPEPPDFSRLPPPEDDGAAAHLPGRPLPDIALPATDGRDVNPARLPGRTIIYAYPMTARPGTPLPDGWDMIPGARGCTPQACAFRDHAAGLAGLGVNALFGLSVQDRAWQREAARRLHLPFALLSDHTLAFARALSLPLMEVAGRPLLKRLTLVIDEGRISHVFYPVFPPDSHVQELIAWLQANP